MPRHDCVIRGGILLPPRLDSFATYHGLKVPTRGIIAKPYERQAARYCVKARWQRGSIGRLQQNRACVRGGRSAARRVMASSGIVCARQLLRLRRARAMASSPSCAANAGARRTSLIRHKLPKYSTASLRISARREAQLKAIMKRHLPARREWRKYRNGIEMRRAASSVPWLCDQWHITASEGG